METSFFNPYLGIADPNQGGTPFSENSTTPPLYPTDYSSQPQTVGMDMPPTPGAETIVAQTLQTLRKTLDAVCIGDKSRTDLLQNVTEIKTAVQHSSSEVKADVEKILASTDAATSKPKASQHCLDIYAKIIGAVALALLSPKLFILGVIVYVANYVFNGMNQKDDKQDIKELKDRVNNYMLDNLEPLYNVILYSKDDKSADPFSGKQTQIAKLLQTLRNDLNAIFAKNKSISDLDANVSEIEPAIALQFPKTFKYSRVQQIIDKIKHKGWSPFQKKRGIKDLKEVKNQVNEYMLDNLQGLYNTTPLPAIPAEAEPSNPEGFATGVFVDSGTKSTSFVPDPMKGTSALSLGESGSYGSSSDPYPTESPAGIAAPLPR